VNGFLAFCTARGYNRNALMLNIHQLKVVTRERLRLSTTEILQALDATADPRDRAMLAVAMNLGLRAGEITSLTVGNVDLTKQSLHVFVSKSGIEDRMPSLATWTSNFDPGSLATRVKPEQGSPPRPTSSQPGTDHASSP
jgi:integrase